MINRFLSSLLLLALATAPAWGSDKEEPAQAAKASTEVRVCTDLSGKFKLPCPGDSKAAPSPQSTAGPAQSQAAAPKPASGEPIRAFRPAPVESGRSTSPAQPVATVEPAAARENPPVGEPNSATTQGGKPKSVGEPIRAFRPAPVESGRPVSLASPVSTASKTDTAPAQRVWVRRSPFAFSYGAASLRRLPENLLLDQKNFWTSPARIRGRDASLLVPFAGATAGLLAFDTDIEKRLPTNPTLVRRSKDFGTYGAAAFAGIAGGAFVLGRLTQSDHMAETGLLSGEAAVNSLAVVELLKTGTGRQRPLEGNGQGDFRAGGNSFPSEHSAAAWSIATVIAHEYPGPLTQLLAYGGATAMTASRVLGRQHFSSDALVGSALGWFIGRQVYRAHNAANAEDVALYGTFLRDTRPERPRDPANMGSPYIPLDSWIYPAMDRLAALGYIRSAFAGLRPWTRMECARLLDEAATQAQDQSDDASSSEALRLLRSLKAEFAFEADRQGGASNLGAQIESVYSRLTGISGKPLTDGYHFGQTIINDFGRPYQEGANLITGFSARAEAGPLAFYFRGEYQHAPAAPALPEAARQAIGLVDHIATPPSMPVAATTRLVPLEAYVAFKVENWQLSAGKQALWWGPGQGGPMLLSDNAEPLDMIRLSRTSPFKLPSIFGLLGPIRSEVFLGRLSGYSLVLSPEGMVGQYGISLRNQPFIHGGKISFRPTPNLEFGVFRTTVYGGPGYPLTMRSLARSLFSTGNELAGDVNKPGDRRSGIDFSYRIPKLRNWLTFYGDGFTDDEYSPIGYVDRSAWRAGLYLAQVPRIRQLDFRVEGVYTDNPLGGNLGSGFYYFNGTWRSGYTNRNNLIGSWIGRDGQGAQAWATYHFNPRAFAEITYRHQKASRQFIPGTISDFAVASQFSLHSGVGFSGSVQYEKWNYPALESGAVGTWVTSLQVTYRPRLHGH